MPEISDDDLKEFNQLRSSSVGLQLENAKLAFRAENSHVPAALITAYQGDPAGLGEFGKALLEQFPKPQASPPPPAPVAPAAAPVVPAPVLPAPPALPAAPPVAQFVAPQSPEAQRQAYLQGAVNGQAQIPGMVPAPAPVPSPGSADALTQQNSVTAQSEQIREKMRIGTATRADAQWLAQFGEKGFTSAMTTHARKVAAVVGRN